MKNLLKYLPLKWKRRINKQLRRVGLAAPTQKRVRKSAPERAPAPFV